ncbi:MAG: hypothetical protein ACJAUY_002050 [Cognaticolwellia sp.]|jgi:hypothetical protein
MSQIIIKGFPKLESNPSKLKTVLSIVLVYAPFYTYLVEFFTVQSQLREWGVFEDINTNISASLPVVAKS